MSRATHSHSTGIPAQVFDFDKWAEHRSAWKYAQQVMALPFSHTLRSIAPPLAWVVLVTLAVGANVHAAAAGLLPRWAALPRDAAPRARPPPTYELFCKRRDCSRHARSHHARCGGAGAVMAPLTLTSFALSLLLVFRTNASYGRFAEARQVWGLLLNRSRDLARQAVAFLPAGAADAKATLARWTMAFSKALLCHLRASSSLQHEAAGVLCREELELLLSAEHPVVLTLQVRSPEHTLQATLTQSAAQRRRNTVWLQVLSELIEAAPITELQRWQMHANLTELHDVLGACERILRTPIPVAYTRHTSRSVILWMTALPLALWPQCGWATVALAPLVGVLLLGINEIGIDVEEPFSLLPLEAIADRAARDVTQTIDMQVPPVRLHVRAQSFRCHSVKFVSQVSHRSSSGTVGAAQPVQVRVMDHLTQARDSAINAHVFESVSHERAAAPSQHGSQRRKHTGKGRVDAPEAGMQPGGPVSSAAEPSSAAVRGKYFGRGGDGAAEDKVGLIRAAPSAACPPASGGLPSALGAPGSVDEMLSGV